VDDDRVAFDDLDVEVDRALARALGERELHVREVAGAEQSIARELEARVVEIDLVALTERDVAEDGSRARARIAADADRLELVAHAELAGLGRLARGTL